MPEIAPTTTQEQLDLAKQQDAHQYSLAKLNIEKNAEISHAWASSLYKGRIASFVFIGVILIVILGFCAYAMTLGKDAIAMEIVKLVSFTGIGGGAGYFYGFAKGKDMPRQ